MKMTEFLLSELDREVERSRWALESVPDGRYDWKPHERSMAFGPLVFMVATIPTWFAMMIDKDELDIKPTGGSQMERKRLETAHDLVEALDSAATEARTALKRTSDEHLMKAWRLLAGGQVAMEAPRLTMLQDTMNHWAHHRGQMTVYLRLMGAKVPAIYGPSADDERFR